VTNLALRPDRWPFSLEKWYLDVLLPDGTVLLVYLGRMRLFCVPFARVTAELFRPDGTVVRSDAAARDLSGGPDRLRFGAARIDGDLLTFELPGMSGALRYRPRHPAVSLREPFLVSGDRTLTWTVEIPDADVEGELRLPGGTVPIRGRGYRDRVWFDLLPWRFPIQELRWGRAVAGEHAATWVRARTSAGVVGAAWQDGRTLDAFEPTLGPDRALITSAIADLEGLRMGWLRPILRRISGDPREVKWAAPATIDGDPGVAIHEVVRWAGA
jgi:hypothetical protein